jgi:hypothetical protein
MASCSDSKKIKIPEDVLSRDTMAIVLTDIHLVQASQRLGVVMDTTDTVSYTSFRYVWNKHHITEAEYKKSLDFYTHSPGMLDSIYEKVLTNLSRQKAELSGKEHSK